MNCSNKRKAQINTLVKKFNSRIGEKFGKLTIKDVVNFEYEDGRSRNLYLCECECGETKLLPYYDLTSGKVVSCGCFHKEVISKNSSQKTFYDHLHKYDWYFFVGDKKISCKSSYEVIFANYLNLKGIKFEYEPKTFKLKNGKRYTPDFYSIDSDEWFELKGNFGFNKYQEESVEIFSKDHNLNIFFWDEIRNFCNLKLKYWNSYMKRAKKYDGKVEDYFAYLKYM